MDVQADFAEKTLIHFGMISDKSVSQTRFHTSVTGVFWLLIAADTPGHLTGRFIMIEHPERKHAKMLASFPSISKNMLAHFIQGDALACAVASTSGN